MLLGSLTSASSFIRPWQVGAGAPDRLEREADGFVLVRGLLPHLSWSPARRLQAADGYWPSMDAKGDPLAPVGGLGALALVADRGLRLVRVAQGRYAPSLLSLVLPCDPLRPERLAYHAHRDAGRRRFGTSPRPERAGPARRHPVRCHFKGLEAVETATEAQMVSDEVRKFLLDRSRPCDKCSLRASDQRRSGRNATQHKTSLTMRSSRSLKMFECDGLHGLGSSDCYLQNRSGRLCRSARIHPGSRG